MIELDSDNAGRFLSGLRRRGHWPDAEAVAVYGPPASPNALPPYLPRSLLGTGHVKTGELIPGRLLSPIEVAQAREQQEQSQRRRLDGVQQISQI
jgi:tRNA pseudouridine55 synthase